MTLSEDKSEGRRKAIVTRRGAKLYCISSSLYRHIRHALLIHPSCPAAPDRWLTCRGPRRLLASLQIGRRRLTDG
ncbi:hypothetical protein E2C01_056301 [Portunus trituberculatus]|uniref:Uncharacterized protein n=1 Tax=Portunus trituberculatus TaxID=210409 RepID=A0A5B7GZ87_PORTR|nr:hypothetical protein [Portunus trituberculatus]